MTTPKIGIICGSTRPGRIGGDIAQWVYASLKDHSAADVELIDIADFNLPVLDEADFAATGNYAHDHTKAWSAAVAHLDGFIFVTPEYNHSTSGALKNALDYLYNEFCHKAAGFVSYGYTDGLRAVEHLRLILANFNVATVRSQVGVSLGADVTDGTFTPRDHHQGGLEKVLNEVVTWTNALKSVRSA